MANPNIVGVTDIRGKTAGIALTTSAAAIVNNAAASGKVFKINMLSVSNVDGVSDATVTVNYYSQDDLGGTARKLADRIAVPPGVTILVIDKDHPLYLEEDRSIGALASLAGDLEVVASWEEIS